NIENMNQRENDITRPEVKRIVTRSVSKNQALVELNEERPKYESDEGRSDNKAGRRQPEVTIKKEQPKIFTVLFLANKQEDSVKPIIELPKIAEPNVSDKSEENRVRPTKASISKKTMPQKRINHKILSKQDKPIKFDNLGDESCTFEKYMKIHLPRIRKDHEQLSEKEALNVVNQLWNMS
ncbi:6049_t:CDS:1, partial [Acaulospora morrowiae]